MVLREIAVYRIKKDPIASKMEFKKS